MPLPEYLIYQKESESSDIEIRKIKGGKEVGISVAEDMYQYPFSRKAETFLNKSDAEKLIQALQEYFHIT